MRLRLLILAIGAGGALAACGSDSSPAPAAQSGGNGNAITIKNFAYGPAKLHVTKGTTVTWTNNDPTAHTTTSDKSDAQTWDSGNLSPKSSYAVVFTKDGTYSFHCDIHNYMTGTITVSG